MLNTKNIDPDHDYETPPVQKSLFFPHNSVSNMLLYEVIKNNLTQKVTAFTYCFYQ